MLSGVVRGFVVLLGLLALPAQASEADANTTRDALSRAQQYWNSITTLEGRFQQVVDGKPGLSGEIFLQKPGKLRLKYFPPSELVIVADGDTAAVYDAALDQLSYLDQEKLPLNFLLQNFLSFEALSLAPVVYDRPNYYEIAITNPEWSIQSPLTLVFAKDPVELQFWRFIDAAGKHIQVSLQPVRVNQPIDPSLFIFRNPRYVRE